MEIKPHIGYGNIKFGMSEQEVIKLLGRPTHRAVLTEEGEPEDVTLEYENHGVDLSFTADDAYRLGAITFYHTYYLLNGIEFIDMSEADLLREAPKAGIHDLELDFNEDETYGKNYASDELGLLFWVLEGVVDSVSILPQYADNEEDIIWPE